LEKGMKITVLGRGNVGGGLARLWERAGHEVTALGKEGGDATDADVIVVAVPAGAIADALAKVDGVHGKIAIDTTNAIRGRPEGFDSLAAQVKSLVGGPTAKAFNTIFATTYDEVAKQRATPSCLWCGDDEARDATETLIRDAGFEPVHAGGLERAADVEDFLLGVQFPVAQGSGGPFFYRIASPGEL
jgi:predicted dinucleotide-binding enzyme